MIKTLHYCCLTLLFCVSFAAPVLAQYDVKDSYYFMKGDNEFSDEEKDEEAEYIHMLCSTNSMQNLYFNCACIAGAYRQERDKGPIIPQGQLLDSLFNDNERGCANTEAIAGRSYKFCDNHTKTFSPRDKNNKEYCECVANKVANDFKEEPLLRTNHINRIRINAMSYCR